MIRKEIVSPGRLRRIPEGFGWVDHRLVRKGYLKGKSRKALALYLFLVTVADADGVSYYSRESLCEQLDFTAFELGTACAELVNAGLVAYRKPFYQVLSLPAGASESENFNSVLREAFNSEETSSPVMAESSPSAKTSLNNDVECMAIGEIIKSMAGGR